MKSEYLVTIGVSCGLIAAAVVGLAVYGLVGVGETNSLNSPTNDSAEAQFARDMSEHHAQAVTMSFLVRERTKNQEVRDLAFDIINTQSTQRGMMLGWLDVWGLSLASIPHEMPYTKDGSETVVTMSMSMPGMATMEEIERLKNSTDSAADLLFLELMIRHHEGGVVMTEQFMPRSTHESVIRLAQTIIEGQQSEIEFMKELSNKIKG